MGIAGSLVTIILAWWIAFFMLLPLGVKSQLESGEIVPGTEPAAPAAPYLLYKALGALAVAIVVWAALFAAIEYRVITFEQLVGEK